MVNCNADPVDDDTVWDAQITYDQADEGAKRPQRMVVDNHSLWLKYTGAGWQGLGGTESVGSSELEYLPGRIKGTLAESGTAGNKLLFQFRGTGVEVIGDTGNNHGIANIALDGKPAATLDTFRPPPNWPLLPPTLLWGIQDLNDSEHVLELTVTGQKNRESAGTIIGIDAVVVLNGEAIEPKSEK